MAHPSPSHPTSSGVAARVRHLAEHRAVTHERHVDALRAIAIVPVVLGHWFLVAVTDVDDGLDGVNALGALGWARPLTWLFQVMPVFFLVGGYANAASFERHREAGGDAAGWVLARYERLLRPAATLLAVLAGAVVVARLAGVDHDQAATAAWVATVPLWFLLVYLAVVAAGPALLAADRRWGLAVPGVLVLAVLGGDVARYALDAELVAEANYLAAWAAIHQVGVAWRRGRIRAEWRVGWLVAVVGAVALLVLVAAGPYPVSMVGVPGGDQNSDPPTLALLALAAVQTGVVLAVRDRSERWLQAPRRWVAATAVNAIVMTLFLWHMSAAIVAAVVLHGTGLLPAEPIGSGQWLLLRVPWLLACAAVLAVLAAATVRVELRPRQIGEDRRVPRMLLPLLAVGVVTTLAGMLGIALAGRGEHGPLGLPSWALAAVGLGVLLLAACRRRVTQI